LAAQDLASEGWPRDGSFVMEREHLSKVWKGG
jgi:hypothetical protein